MATDPADAASTAWLSARRFIRLTVGGLARRSYSNAKQSAAHFNSPNGEVSMRSLGGDEPRTRR